MTEETIEKVDGEALDLEMAKAVGNLSKDPAEQSATIFTMYKPLFEKAVKKLSSKDKTRVLEALVMQPLVNVPLKSLTAQEAFYYGDSMLQAKFVMMMETYKNSAEEIIALQEEANKTEITTEYTKEVTNG